MTTGALVVLALLELEDDLLVALELLDDLSLYLGLRSFSGIGNNFVAIDNSDSRKGDLRAHFSIELFDIEIVSSGNLVLLTTGLYDCVHAYSYKCVKTQAVILSAWQGRVNKTHAHLPLKVFVSRLSDHACSREKTTHDQAGCDVFLKRSPSKKFQQLR